MLEIKTLVVSPFEENCYLVWEPEHHNGVIIDPGDEDELIVSQVEKNGFEPQAILLTHGHGDHIGAVKPLKEKYDIPIYIGKEDAPMLQSPSENVSAVFGYEIVCPPADHLVSDGDVIGFGKMKFTVIDTPGHSKGGVCYHIDRFLFCGDTLFKNSVGGTDLPGGDYETLIASIDKKLLPLPDDLICFPGHGPATTIGEERRNNPFISGRRFV